MSWYYALNGKQQGPVSDDELTQLVNAGTVRAETLVWKDGWPDWRAYGTVAPTISGAATAMADADTAVCAVSGQRRPKRDMLEFEGRWVSAEHKDEFLQRLREGVSLPSDVVYGTFGRRFSAKFIDGLIVGVVNAVISAFLGAALASAGKIVVQVVVQLVGISLTLAYLVYFIRKNDATPGKKAMGLRLLRADGSKLSKRRIIGRHFAEYLSSLTLLIGYLMAAFDKEQRRALHDRIADTRVIDVRGL